MTNNTVLLIEDDADLNELYAVYLRRAGYDVVVAHNAAQAFDYLNDSTPAAVVTDLGLPDGSGTQIIQWLNNNEPFANTRIIVISGHDNAKKHRISRYHINSVLLKPVLPRHLRIIVEQEVNGLPTRRITA
jgi:two-component system, NtrC family, response regulator PilR